jgi:ABC-type uncharacterized transport system substrate-binding protein
MIRRIFSYSLIALALSLIVNSAAAEPLCLYVSSYHKGYQWNDGIESGLETGLNGACQLQRFYMDTKRNKGKAFATLKATEAKQLIDQIQPDVVIACDDNASEYLVVPHLINTKVPVIFCGVNWSVDTYGYPYANVTGMIEVAPIQSLVKQASSLVDKPRTLGFISADVPTQHKEKQRLQTIAADEGLAFKYWLVDSYENWKKTFIEAQNSSDILLLGNPAGINDWDTQDSKNFIPQNTRKLTASFGNAMSRHAVFAMVNTPVEQGEWSAELAKLILAGESPANLPITSNRRWQTIANPSLAKKIGIKLAERILQNAEIVEPDNP